MDDILIKNFFPKRFLLTEYHQSFATIRPALLPMIPSTIITITVIATQVADGLKYEYGVARQKKYLNEEGPSK